MRRLIGRQFGSLNSEPPCFELKAITPQGDGKYSVLIFIICDNETTNNVLPQLLEASFIKSDDQDIFPGALSAREVYI